VIQVPDIRGILAAGYPGDATGPQRNLIKHWTSGKGGLRIGWRTKGAMKRCIAIMKQPGHLPPNYSAGGFCANLHKKATGEWPTEGGKRGVPS